MNGETGGVSLIADLLPGFRPWTTSGRRSVSSLLLTALLLLSGSAMAADPAGVEVKRNPDGSRLRLTQQINTAGDRRVFRIDVSPSASAPYTILLQSSQVLSEYPRGGGRLDDMDGDGQLEFVERMFCGAGPNCWYRIHKLNPEQHKAYLFFEGGFSLFRPIAGYLVTSGRSSCCSWTHQIYRAPETPRGITEQDLLYNVDLKGPIDGSATPTCWISRPVAEDWEQAELPNPKLLTLCEGYGNDVVINPNKATDKD